MTRLWTILGVRDVRASYQWYRELLGLPTSAPAHDCFCRVDDLDAALERTQARGVVLTEEPHRNPNTRTMEFSLRDPDGYFVTVSRGEHARPLGDSGPATGGVPHPRMPRSGASDVV